MDWRGGIIVGPAASGETEKVRAQGVIPDQECIAMLQIMLLASFGMFTVLDNAVLNGDLFSPRRNA